MKSSIYTLALLAGLHLANRQPLAAINPHHLVSNNYSLAKVMPAGKTEGTNVGDYTYQNDRKFTHVLQFNETTFIPQSYKEGEGGEIIVDVNDLKIHFSQNHVFFKGIEELEMLRGIGIVHKSATLEGYEFHLSDKVSGAFSRLTIFTTNDRFVKKIEFKSKFYGEYTFLFPVKRTDVMAVEQAYFTPKSAYKVVGWEDLTDKIMVPQFRILNCLRNRSRDKIAMEQGIQFEFKDKYVTFTNTGGKQEKIAVKKTRIGNNVDAKRGNVRKIMTCKTKGKKDRQLLIMLNSAQEVEYIQLDNVQYQLALQP
ncbi:MAG: hypothetical protein IPG29_16510 [Sphingobacteriales bacterium]|nr:hypothetical protein [Sphingobacteriales bacterium]